MVIVHLTAELPHSGEALNIGDKVTLWIHATVCQVEDEGVDVSKVNERLGTTIIPGERHVRLRATDSVIREGTI